MNNSYKADITLNEQDSLQDMLNLEKQITKVYSTALTEGVGKSFRNQIKANFEKSSNDQLDVFLTMTNFGYAKVESATQDELKKNKKLFYEFNSQLN
ncbi:MAG: spore coat protein [Clostridia bacterium]|nr:spore coat protein [Clostridia bacterium]